MLDGPPPQMLSGEPATAVAAALMVNIFDATPLVHPGLRAVSVKVTLPAILSAALGL